MNPLPYDAVAFQISRTTLAFDATPVLGGLVVVFVLGAGIIAGAVWRNRSRRKLARLGARGLRDGSGHELLVGSRLDRVPGSSPSTVQTRRAAGRSSRRVPTGSLASGLQAATTGATATTLLARETPDASAHPIEHGGS
jgi:hypothetical protein